MKSRLLVICCILLGITTLEAQNPAVDFYRQHKRSEGVRNFKIPGWLVWLGSGITHEIVKDENDKAKAALKLARKVKKMRLLVVEDYNPIPTMAVNNFMRDSRRSGYSDLIYVRDGETTVNIMGRIKKNEKFRDLIIMVSEENEFVFFHMKSNIKMKDLNNMLRVFMDKLPINDETRRKEREQEAKKKKRNQKIPKA